MSIARKALAWFAAVQFLVLTPGPELAAQTRTITPGQTLTATMDAQTPLDEFDSPFHEYYIAANPGDLITVTVRSTAIDPLIEWGLVDRDGTFYMVWDDDDSGGGLDSRISVVAYGETDRLRVSSLTGELGSYTISVERVPVPAAHPAGTLQTLPPNGSVTTRISSQNPLGSNGLRYVDFAYVGGPDDIIEITPDVLGGDGAAFTFMLWGVSANGDFFIGDAYDLDVAVFPAGPEPWTLRVGVFESAFANGGSLDLRLTSRLLQGTGTGAAPSTSAPQGTGSFQPIAANQPVSGALATTDPSLSNGAYYDLYLYQGQPGQQVTVTMTSSAFDTYLAAGAVANGEFQAELFDDDGGGGTNSRIATTLGPSGTLAIRAYSYSPAATGAYTLMVTPGVAVTQAPTGAGQSQFRPIAANQVVSAQFVSTDPRLTDNSHYHLYLYRGQPGEQITITMRSTVFDAYLYGGREENGQFVSETFDDDSGGGTDARITAVVGPSGTYAIRANTFSGNQTGPYTIVVETSGGGAQGAGGAQLPQGYSPIGANQTLSATFVGSDPRLTDNSHYHMYLYRGQPGEQITITMRSSEFDTYLSGGRVQDGAFIQEAANDDGAGGTDSQLTAVTDAAGTYAIRANTLYGGVTGTYTLTVQAAGQLPQGVRPIAVGQTVSGLFTASDPRLGDNSHYHDYIYRGQPGEQIVVTMRSAAFDAYLMGGRFDNNQFVAEQSNDDGAGGTDAQLTATVGANGTYAIRANTLFGGNTGAYTLAVQSASAPVAAGTGPAVLRVGQTVSGRLQQGDPRLGDDSFYHPYIYEGAAGERLVITMTSAEFDTYLRFGYDRNGQFEVITYDDDGGGGTNSRIVVTLPQTARYQIQANSYSAGSTGWYTLSVEDAGAPGPANVATIALNQTIQSRLEASDPVLSDNSHYKLFAYSGTPGEQVLVTMRSSEFDTYLTTGRLIAGQFEAEQSNDDGGGGTDSQILTTIGADGILLIRANSFAGGRTGAFTLTVQPPSSVATTPPPAPAGSATIAAGQTIQGMLTTSSRMLSDSSYFDQYVYQGSPGDRLAITLTSSAFDAYLMWGRLDGDRFQGIAYDDDSGGGTNARLEVTVDGTGVFALRANAYYPGETGAYTLTIQRLDAATPTPGAPPVAGPTPAPAPSNPNVQTGGKFVHHYVESPNAHYTALSQRIKQRRILEEITGQLNARLHLPRNIDVLMDECGMVNAFYIPSETMIVFCYELLDLLAAIFVPDGQWTPELMDQVDGAVRFILMHEIGHSLVHVLDLPITGREEDVVDQLAVFQLVRGGDEKGAQAAVNGVSAIQPATTEFDDLDFADEHSLGPVRLFNVLCWIYGSDPMKFSPIVDNGWLPEDRAVRCPSEWDRMSKAWQTILSQYTIQ
ncbi:MAG TPA: DUF4344 domain-containing metallopeptidase [Longimicrobiales bacterium]|nr:DUF4344 domain-containing metallopeptidase [Longimicrobiales bacterium]